MGNEDVPNESALYKQINQTASDQQRINTNSDRNQTASEQSIPSSQRVQHQHQ